jgi:hypothetical protein
VGGGRVNRKGEGGRIWWKYFIFMYGSRTMKHVGIVLRKGEEGDEGE